MKKLKPHATGLVTDGKSSASVSAVEDILLKGQWEALLGTLRRLKAKEEHESRKTQGFCAWQQNMPVWQWKYASWEQLQERGSCMNPWFMRTLEQDCGITALEEVSGSDTETLGRDWPWNMASWLKRKPHARVSHAKYKIINSLEETGTRRYLERKW